MRGTGAMVRVLITSRDGHQWWNTVGLATDIIDASWQALWIPSPINFLGTNKGQDKFKGKGEEGKGETGKKPVNESPLLFQFRFSPLNTGAPRVMPAFCSPFPFSPFSPLPLP